MPLSPLRLLFTKENPLWNNEKVEAFRVNVGINDDEHGEESSDEEFSYLSFRIEVLCIE